MIYTIYMWAVISICTIFFGGSLIILVPFDRKGHIYKVLSRLWGRCIVWSSRVPLELEGVDKIPPMPCIYMSNHQSYFDVISLIGYLPVPVRFVAKRVLTYIPVFGQALWASGHIIIDRANPRQSFDRLDRAVEKIHSGTSVLVFPEGTRSPDHKLGPFKKGGFVLAIKAGVPIVPISITGTHPMMPKGSFTFRKTRVRIKIGDPVVTEGYELERKEDIMSVVRSITLKNFEPGSAEAEANKEEIAAFASQ